jgi:uncharacterized membrane protein YccF (DUF307 family)
MLDASATSLLIPVLSARKPRKRSGPGSARGRCPGRLLRCAQVVDSPGESPSSKRARARSAVRSGGHWVGYGWFMSFGTVLPLFIFLGGYAVHLTIVGAPVARRIYRLGIWTATLGQDPPGKDKVEAKLALAEKKPFFERVRPYSPPGWLERRDRPVSMPARVVWFVFVGWWAGAVWVVISWSPFLLPYPLFDTVATLLGEVPCTMTLAQPEQVEARDEEGRLRRE